jgi:hypothetical protein
MTVSATERELISEWDDLPLSSEELRQLRQILPVGKSWFNDLEVLGDLESTCLTIHKRKSQSR